MRYGSFAAYYSTVVAGTHDTDAGTRILAQQAVSTEGTSKAERIRNVPGICDAGNVLCRLILFRCKHVFPKTAYGTGIILRNFFPLCAGRDSVFGIADCFIVNIAARANIFHIESPNLLIHNL